MGSIICINPISIWEATSISQLPAHFFVELKKALQADYYIFCK